MKAQRIIGITLGLIVGGAIDYGIINLIDVSQLTSYDKVKFALIGTGLACLSYCCLTRGFRFSERNAKQYPQYLSSKITHLTTSICSFWRRSYGAFMRALYSGRYAKSTIPDKTQNQLRVNSTQQCRYKR
jgi:hypothetical protein